MDELDKLIEAFEKGEIDPDEYVEKYNEYVQKEANKRKDLWNS